LQRLKRHSRAILIGAALTGIASALTLVIDGEAVKQEFYTASAAAIPVFLLALLLRLARLRDTVLEMLDEASDKEFLAEVQDLQDAAEDDARRQELANVVSSRQQNADALRAMAPSIFGSLIGTYFLAVLGEGAALFALGSGTSTAWTLIAVVISMTGIVGSLIHLELLDYRLQFADRGLLLTRRGIKTVDLAEYVRAEFARGGKGVARKAPETAVSEETR
jgi:hypothetical protein